MKTHRNMASTICSLPRMLFALCCLVLMMAQPALAQEADENGRSAADLARQGAPAVDAPANASKASMAALLSFVVVVQPLFAPGVVEQQCPTI